MNDTLLGRANSAAHLSARLPRKISLSSCGQSARVSRKNLSSIHTRGEKKTRAANDEAVRLTALRVYKATLDPAYSAAQFPLLSGILSLPFPRRQRANRLARCVYTYLQPAARPALASPVRMTLSRGGNGGRPAVWRMRPGK